MTSQYRYCLHAAIALTFHFGAPATAANILWDGTGTSWNNASSWSLFSNATTPNPAAKPGASDTAIFNIETLFGAQTVNLNAPQAALGLVFNTSGGGNIVTGTGVNALTIGAGGISVSPGALPLSIQTAVNLSAPQTWNNDGGLVLNINGAVNHGGNHLTIAGQGGSPLNGNTTINGALGAGNLTLTKNGSGALRLNGANQFSGDLVLNAGSVVLGNTNGISSSTDVDLLFGPGSTGVLSLNGNNARFASISTDTIVGTPVIQNGAAAPATLTVGRLTTPTQFAGVLRDGPGGAPLGLAVVGSLGLSGNNEYTGLTEITGALQLKSASALGSVAAGTILGEDAFSGPTLDLSGQAISGEELTASRDSRLINTSPLPASWAGDIGLETGISGREFSLGGVGDLTLTGRIFTVDPPPFPRRRIEKSGQSTLTLSGAAGNDVDRLTIRSGVVRLDKVSNATVVAVNDVLVSNGTLQLAGTGGNQLAGTVELTAGTFDVNGRDEELNFLTLNGPGVDGVGALVHSSSGTSTLTIANSHLTYAHRVIIGSFTRIGVTQAGANLILPGLVNLVGAGGDSAVQKVGQGTLVINGSSAGFYGGVLLTSGTLAVGHDEALGDATILGTRALTFEGGALRSEGAPRTINVPISVTTSGVITGALDLTLTGPLTGAGPLTKNGTGKLTLTATSAYSGATAVDAGSLAVNGSIAGNVIVNPSGTLIGSGAVAGSVIVNSGGVLAPGDSAAEITLGSLTLEEGATLQLEIGGLLAGMQHDQVESSGAIALGGTLQVTLVSGFMPAVGQEFDLLNWGVLSGAFDTLQLPELGGLTWDTSQLYTTGVLSVAGFTGDYNNDGLVNAADYTVWRDGGPLQNETASIGVVDAADFAAWSANYGTTAASSALAAPEPAGTFLIIAAGISALRRRGLASR